jgi:hypothetical protein
MKKQLSMSASKLWIVLFIGTNVLMLTACSSLKVQEQAAPIQANLLAKCEPLTEHEGKTGSMVLLTLTRWATEYNECAARHNGLVDAIKGGL